MTVNRIRKFFVILSVLSLALWPFGIRCHAAEEYTYTVTFYPGNHGTFGGIGAVSVGGKNTSDINISMEGQAIKVRGLRSGDMVSFDAALSGAVMLEENSQYYVKGIRLSGRDNNTIDTSAFRVEGDRDYVVAYGIRGDMTSYVVNYQDEAGNTLAESRSYYGNVGDKPVVAFLYVEGYEPRAYNLTKTLVSNEAENVFTFVYTRSAVSEGGNASSGGNGTGGGNSPSGGNEGMGDTGNSEPGDGGLTGDAMPNTNGAGEAGTGGTNNGEGNIGLDVNGGDAEDGIADNETNDANGGNDAQATADDENVILDDNEVPLDLMELDEEEVPLAENALTGMLEMEEGSRIFAASAALAAISAGVLVFFAIWLKRHSKKRNR